MPAILAGNNNDILIEPLREVIDNYHQQQRCYDHLDIGLRLAFTTSNIIYYILTTIRQQGAKVFFFSLSIFFSLLLICLAQSQKQKLQYIIDFCRQMDLLNTEDIIHACETIKTNKSAYYFQTSIILFVLFNIINMLLDQTLPSVIIVQAISSLICIPINMLFFNLQRNTEVTSIPTLRDESRLHNNNSMDVEQDGLSQEEPTISNSIHFILIKQPGSNELILAKQSSKP